MRLINTPKKQILTTVFLIISVCGGLLAYKSTNKAKPPANEFGVSVPAIRDLVLRSYQTSTSPSMVFSLYQGSIKEPTVAMALGYIDDEKSRPIQLEDHFWIGSISKTLIGHTVLQLQEEGLLNLDESIDDYIANSAYSQEITVAMLGFQTSGIADITENQEFQRAVEKSPEKVWTDDELLVYAKVLKPNHQAGKDWSYSNTNTILLAKIIEAVTGRPWDDVVKTRILDPLEINATAISDDGNLPTPHPVGYRYTTADRPFKYGKERLKMDNWNPSWAGAAGSYYSNEKELAIITRALSRGSLLSRNSFATLQKWQRTKVKDLKYGFQIWNYFDAFVLFGDVHGYSSFSAYIPELDITLVVLANLSNSSDGTIVALNTGLKLIDQIYTIK